MATVDDLLAVIVPRLEGTPYRVAERVPDGFDLHADLADARWWGVLSRSGTRHTFGHRVRVTRGGSYTLEQRAYRFDWRVGSGGGRQPVATGQVQVFRGRSWTFTRRKVLAVRDDGTVGTVVDVDFGSQEGAEIVKQSAAELGMRRGFTFFEKCGLVGATFGGLAAVSGGVMAYLDVTGRL